MVEVGLVSLGCLATVTVTNVEEPDCFDGAVATTVGKEFRLPLDCGAQCVRRLCQGDALVSDLERDGRAKWFRLSPGIDKIPYSFKLPASLVRPNAQAERPAEPGRSSLLFK